MFKIFKKKTELEKLESQYHKLLKEAHSLSTTNRKLSDNKSVEANQVLAKIEALKLNS
ncbi:Lacal_2735 family protein [Saccharicrinis aurantiacus]|uniref:Lacal_2735 family protein n=1 Tax=Saccharicrinis aurantiacus TaxID=1849719 RepID=UPI00111538B5|nr:Lacal_2735 family protein [Saccharicrinis aurantiacus]